MLVRIGHDDAELVAAVAKQEIAGATIIVQRSGDHFQRFVAGAVTELIVDFPERIDVYDDAGQAGCDSDSTAATRGSNDRR